MILTTLSTTYSLQSSKFIPNQELKFLYIQPGKLPNTLAILTTIPELSNISKCEGIFFHNSSLNFLFKDEAISIPISIITNIDSICRELNTPKAKFSKPILYIESYNESFRLTYSEMLIPHPMFLNFISIEK